MDNIIFEDALADQDNRNILINLRNRYKCYIEADELYRASLIALYKCISNHNPDFGKFTSSLHQHMVWECRRLLQEKRRAPPLSSLPANLTQSTLTETEVIRECLDLLPSYGKKVLWQYFYCSMTYEEIGRENGYSHMTAMRKIDRALGQLRELYLRE